MLKPPSPENPTNPNRPVIMSAGEFRDFGDNSKKIVGVAAGEAHTLTLTYGSVYLWGKGTFGRLGTGKESNELYPVRVKFDSSKKVGISADRSGISCGPLASKKILKNLRGQHVAEKKRRLGIKQVKALEKNFEVQNKLKPEREVKLEASLGLQFLALMELGLQLFVLAIVIAKKQQTEKSTFTPNSSNKIKTSGDRH
ncbi:hypothetical protein MRB53_014036 [Persea americana]|uniref:Uncharacterized protein n=1 Tax=Persea americana TaxID=3435 RepID=A0ACC2K9R1_PERAE|nr:hypothetical protein MRB53_014036 [Persea americana]